MMGQGGAPAARPGHPFRSVAALCDVVFRSECARIFGDQRVQNLGIRHDPIRRGIPGLGHGIPLIDLGRARAAVIGAGASGMEIAAVWL